MLLLFGLRIRRVATLPVFVIFLFLLTCWNWPFVLGRIWQCLLCAISATEIYFVATIVLEGAERLLHLPSRPLWVAVSEIHDFRLLVVEIVGLILLTGRELDEWCWTIVVRVLLTAWCDRIAFWMGSGPEMKTFHRLVTFLATAATVVCCALQWSFYATLPTEQLGNSPTLLLWHSALLSCLATGIKACFWGWTVIMQWFGFSILARLCEWRGFHPAVLDETFLDPYCKEYRLCQQCLYTLLCAALAFIYMPPDVSLGIQIAVLVRIYFAKVTMDAYRNYRNLLRIFQSVIPKQPTTCGICLEDFGNNEQAKQLPCRHLFHARCLRRWLVHNFVCPNCRQSARPLSLQRQLAAGQPGDNAAHMPLFEGTSAAPPTQPRAAAQVRQSGDDASPTSRARVVNTTFGARPPTSSPTSAGGARSCLNDHHTAELHGVEQRLTNLRRAREALRVPGQAVMDTQSTNGVAHVTQVAAHDSINTVADHLFVDEPLRLRARRGRRRRRETPGTLQSVVDEGPPQRRSRK